MATPAPKPTIEPTPFQRQVLAVPEDCDLFLGGGRGGAKTYCLLLLSLRHVEQYGDRARVLIVRQTFPGLRDLELEAKFLFHAAYGSAMTFSSQSHTFKFANGASVTIDQIEGPGDFAKFQGRSHSLILIDEAGHYSQPDVLDMLRSTLRSKANIPTRMVLAANPGGQGHGWLQQRHVAGRPAWKPYIEPRSGRQFVTCPSTYMDNPHLDAGYVDQLMASSTDEAMRAAWLYGDWNIQAGGFFGSVFDVSRNVIPPWRELPGTRGRMTKADVRRINRGLRPRSMSWRFFVALDHGSSAPCVALLMAESPGAEHDGRFFPRGSFVIFDEVVFVEHDSLSRGLGLTVPEMAGKIVSICRTWPIKPEGCADDACFSQHGGGAGSLAQEYRRAGLSVQRARKGDRLSGWERMRRLMLDAGKPDVPGLYISEACTYFLQTVPYLARDPKRMEDCDSRGPDHAADAARYGLTFQPSITVARRNKGF